MVPIDTRIDAVDGPCRDVDVTIVDDCDHARRVKWRAGEILKAELRSVDKPVDRAKGGREIDEAGVCGITVGGKY